MNTVKRNIVYCDLDGTLIKGDLEIDIIKYLRRTGKLHIYQYFLAAISMPVNFIMKKCFYSSLLKSWTAFIPQKNIEQWYDEFLKCKDTHIVFNDNVIQLLDYLSNNSKIVILTGSDERLTVKTLEYNNIKNVDQVIGSSASKHGWLLRRHPYGKSKVKYIDREANSIGIANEYADKFYLDLCDVSYVVGNDKRLLRLAKKKKWEMM